MDAAGKTTFTLILTLTSHQLKKGKLDMDQRAKCKNAKRIEFVFMIFERRRIYKTKPKNTNHKVKIKGSDYIKIKDFFFQQRRP